MSENEKPIMHLGFGNPPIENRFVPGKSGNPNGRPAGALGIKGLLRKALEAEGANGQSVVLEMLGKVIESGRSGDIKAAGRLIDIGIKLDLEG
jgi:hypothetical protein